ncbi:hypothetical protein SAMN02910456_00525 [Ruminococcaceae bacterium YRB3002]|nr:hypothetical protein SAMN02910456_00525 [Ruminococcaceae bacterium YRB3002]
MRRIMCMLVLLITGTILINSCSSNSGETYAEVTAPSYEMRDPNAFAIEYNETVPGCEDYDRDAFIRDPQGNDMSSVRIYADSSYYRTVDGVNYIAMAYCAGVRSLTREELFSYSIGDELRIDRDRSIKVTTKIIEERDYTADRDDDMTVRDENGSFVVQLFRPHGRVILSDDYYCIHPEIRLDEDGNPDEYNSYNEEDWMLCRTINGDFSYVRVYDNLRWYRIAENCAVRVFEDERDAPDNYAVISVPDLQTFVIDNRRSPDIEWMHADLTIENGEVTLISVLINDPET